jgi:hypothetical protein
MVFRMKKERVARLQISTRFELLQYCQHRRLPAKPTLQQILLHPESQGAIDFWNSSYFYIPQNAATYSVDGACFTGPKQIRWMEQLLDRPNQFVLHMDGKHKLHHGSWVLITLGTHCLRVEGETVIELSTTFIPLVYLFCLNHESTGACAMLSNALHIVTSRLFNKKVRPGALMSDHSDGVRSGMLSEFDAPHGQCWPHISRKFREGHFCSRKHPLFEQTKLHLDAIHQAHSAGMRDLFTVEMGKLWDALPAKWSLHSFWNEYFVQPWNNWSIGLFDCMLCTPSNNVQESWHYHMRTLKIPGMFKGSTEHVLHVALPQLISMDGFIIPDELTFHVPCVPPRILQSALWYVSHKGTHFASSGDTFYILSRSSGSMKKLDQLLIQRYESLVEGQRPNFVTKLDKMIEIASSVNALHYAVNTNRTCVQCEYNGAEVVCSCKTSRHIGICEHILAVNHFLGHLDLVHLLGDIRGGKRKRGGFNRGTRPALVREDPPRARVKAKISPSPASVARASAATVARASAAAYLPTTPPPLPGTSQSDEEINELQLLLQEKRAQMAEEARMRIRVNKEMSVLMDTGIRVNRGLQEGFRGE